MDFLRCGDVLTTNRFQRAERHLLPVTCAASSLMLRSKFINSCGQARVAHKINVQRALFIPNCSFKIDVSRPT